MKKLSAHTDEELVEKLISSGKSYYFEELYSRYFRKVYYQILSYLKDEEETLDVAQDVFVKLHNRIAKFSGRSSFSTWLFSFSRNTVLDYLRKKGRRKEEKLPEQELEAIPEVADDELLKMRADRLKHVLELVSPEDKSILIQMYAYEWKMEEIAEFIGIGLSAVKMRIKRAKARVKQTYENEYGNE